MYDFASVKAAVVTALGTITVANGFANTITNVYKVPKDSGELNSTDLPALSLFLTTMEADRFDEAEFSYNPVFALGIFAQVNDDVGESATAEALLVSIYDDICTLINDETLALYQKDNVQTVILGDLFIDNTSEKVFGITMLKIIGG